MAFTKSSLLFIALALTFCSTIHALDITAMLGQNPDLAMFNKALTETMLVEQINKLNAVTILAVDNAAMTSLSGKTVGSVRLILSTHVLPGFYTDKMFYETIGPHEGIETLFESSGHSVGRMGYDYVQMVGDGAMAFGSGEAAPHATYDVIFMGTAVNQTETVAVYQVTKPIIARGIEAIAGALTVPGSADAKVLSFSASVGGAVEGGNKAQSPSAPCSCS